MLQQGRYNNISSYIILFFSVWIMIGWQAKIPAFVQFYPGMIAMVFNTALCFFMAAVGILALQSRSYFIRQWVPLFLGAGIIVLSCVVLAQNLLNIDLHVDTLFSEAWLKDPSPKPGRMAPNTCLNFIAAGFVLLLFPAIHYRKIAVIVQILIFAILFVGILSLAGYGLKLELIYNWYLFPRMAVHTALGMILLSIGFLSLWVRHEAYRGFYEGQEDKKIIFLSSGLLLTAAFTAGLAVFAIFFPYNEENFKKDLQESIELKSSDLNNDIIKALHTLELIAHSEFFQNLRQPVSHLTTEDISRMNRMLIITEDIALQVFDNHGKILVNKGDFMTQPSLSIPLNLPYQTHLACNKGRWYIISDMDVIENKGQSFRIHMEHLLPHFTLSLSHLEDSQFNLGDLKICTLNEADKNTALCFPSEKDSQPFTYPLSIKGDKTPIGYALSGERGIINTIDQNGQTIIAAYIPMGTLGLGMVKTVSTYELYQPLREQLHLVLPALLTLLGFSIMFLYSQIVPIVSRTVQSQREAVIAKTLLQSSQMRLQAIFDTVEEGIVIMNDSYTVQSVNPKAMAIFDYTNSEIVGKDIQELIPPKARSDNNGLKAYLERDDSREVPWIEVLGLHKNGTKIPLEVSIKPVMIGENKLFIAILRDISMRKQDEQNLRRAKDQLEESLIQLEVINANNTLLRETSSILQACLTLEETYIPIQKFCEHLFPEASGILYLMKASRNYMESVMTWGNPKYREVLFPPHECWALRRGQNHLVDPHHDHILCRHLRTKKLAVTAYLCVPVMAQSEIIGLFYLESQTPQKTGQSFTADQQLIASTFAEQVGLALSNLRLKDTLKQQSTRDALTGLFNRRYLNEFLEQEMARAIRSHYPVAFIMLDVDHFKKFNDLYGHEAGDIVLKELGRVLQSNVRAGDVTARYGGEEFIIVLHNIPKNVAKQRAEVIRKAVEGLHLQYGNKTLEKVTISLGLAMFPEHGQTSKTLIESADQALYSAKQHGRNQVFVFKGDKEIL